MKFVKYHYDQTLSEARIAVAFGNTLVQYLPPYKTASAAFHHYAHDVVQHSPKPLFEPDRHPGNIYARPKILSCQWLVSTVYERDANPSLSTEAKKEP